MPGSAIQPHAIAPVYMLAVESKLGICVYESASNTELSVPETSLYPQRTIKQGLIDKLLLPNTDQREM